MLVSINELMEMTGKSFRTVKKYISPLKPVREDGRAAYYECKDALELLYPTHDSEMKQEELRYERARREKMELEVAELKGEVIPIREVEKTLSKEYAFVRAQVRALPSKLAKPLSMATDPHLVFTTLTDSIEEALSELKADGEYKLEADRLDAIGARSTEGTGERPEADTETQPSAMGGSEAVSESGSEQHTGEMEDE